MKSHRQHLSHLRTNPHPPPPPLPEFFFILEPMAPDIATNATPAAIAKPAFGAAVIGSVNIDLIKLE